MWKPSVTPSDVIRHSQGPWEDHKYVKVVDGKYYYPNSYDNGRTVSDLKGESSNKATRSDYSKDDSDFDDKNYSKKNAIGNTEFYGFKGKDGRNVIVMEDKKWSLPEGTEIDSKLKKRLEAVSDEIEKRREKGEKISADEWNKLVDDAINGTNSKSSSKKGSSKKSGSKAASSKGSKDSAARAYGKQIIKTMKNKQKETEKQRKRRQNVIDRKAYLNHSYWAPTVDSDELYHHGILGMRWGKRNGPPYPLAAGAHSPEEKKAKYQKSINRKTSDANRYREKAAKLRVKSAKLNKRRLLSKDKDTSYFSKARRANRADMKASKLERKAAKRERQAQRLQQKMSELDIQKLVEGLNNYGAKNSKSWAEKRADKKKAKERMKNLEKARKVRQKNKELAAKKEDILKRGTAEDVRKIRDQLTEEDYRKVFTRLDNENKLDQRINQNIKTNKDKFNEYVSMLQTVANATTSAITVYNNVAKTYNTFNKKGKRMTPIGETKSTEQKTKEYLTDKAKLDEVVANRNKLNNKELNMALNRFKTEDSLLEYYNEKKKKKEG